ncbi:MAG: MFS transporter [Bifidobacterium sp.]|nr:MFS transporter [Bifidobacterium sp.]
MMSLGIVLALNHLYNNWTVAGTMSAAYILALAAVTPFYARLFDRFGQRRVGRAALSLQIISMLAFAFSALARVPISALFALAVIMGLTQFSFGALVRTRWAYALRGPGNEKLLNTAYALESAIDEVVFILGPILAAFLATSVHPVSQLFVPTFACGLGGTFFFALRGTQPPVMESIEVQPAAADDADVRAAMGNGAQTGVKPDSIRIHQLHRHGSRPRSVLLYQGVLPVLVVFIAFNISFNAFDVSVTAMMKALGKEQLLGLQLAMFAVGSCIGGLVFGAREMKGSSWRHMVQFLALLTLGYVLIRIFMDNLILLGVLSVLSGLCVAPIFATGNLIVKNIVPSRSLTEGLSWITTAGQVGASLGSSLAGIVLDGADYHVGLLIPCITTFATLLLAAGSWALARRRAIAALRQRTQGNAPVKAA